MADKTISVPDDVLPVIETLGMPFSAWVAEQLRRHAAAVGNEVTLEQQLVADAELAGGARPTRRAMREAGARMARVAPW